MSKNERIKEQRERSFLPGAEPQEELKEQGSRQLAPPVFSISSGVAIKKNEEEILQHKDGSSAIRQFGGSDDVESSETGGNSGPFTLTGSGKSDSKNPIQQKSEKSTKQLDSNPRPQESYQLKVAPNSTLGSRAPKRKEPYKLNRETTHSKSLPKDVRGKMENAFDYDFSNVTIHQNSGRAKELGAYAYTKGNEIHFAPGQYNPFSLKGQELLGHELTHVVQQNSGNVKATQEKDGFAINDDKRLEKEADEMGKKAAKGESVGNKSTKSKSGFTKQVEKVIQKKESSSGSPINVEGSQSVIKDLAASQPTDFIEGIKTAPGDLNAAFSKESTSLKDGLPKIEQPTGLENIPTTEDETQDSGSADGSSNEGAPELPEVPVATDDSEVIPDATVPVPDVQIGDESIDLTAGEPPEIDLSGDADPSTMQTDEDTETQSVDTERIAADNESDEDFGENDIYPAFDELEEMTPEVEALATPEIQIPELEELPEADAEITAAFNTEAKVNMDEEIAIEMAKNDEQVAKLEEESQKEWENYETELEKETTRVQVEQEKAQKDAQDEIELHRATWQEENQAVMDKFEEDAEVERIAMETKVDEEVERANKDAAQTLKNAEAEATREAQDAQKVAEETEAESENEKEEGNLIQRGWNWGKEQVSKGLDWLKDQFNKIINALKEAVAAIIDAAKELANSIIDLARDFVVSLIKTFGEILKVLVSVALAAFPGIRDRILGLIDTAINVAVEIVNTLAEGLKTFVNALLDALGAALTFLLDAYQKFINLMFDALVFLANFLLGVLQGIVWVVEAAIKMPGHLFWGEMMAAILGSNPNDPLPGIERTAEAAAAETDPDMELLKKAQLEAGDIDIDQILGDDAISPELVEELSEMGEGTYNFAGDANPFSKEEFLGENGALEDEAEQMSPDFANMSDDEKLQYYLEQMQGNLSSSDASPDAVGQKNVEGADQIPDVAKVGPLSAEQRASFLIEQMKIGLEMWWNDNKGWVIPAVVAAVVGAIALIILTAGTAVAAIIQGLLVALTYIFGAILIAQITPLVFEYFTKSFSGDVEGGSKSLAKAFAIGLIELIFTVIFKGIGKMLKGVMKAGLAAVRGLGALARGGAKLVRHIGAAMLRGGKILFKNVGKGVTRAAKKIKDLASRLAKWFRANAVRVIIKGKWLEVQIKINPWKTVLKAKIPESPLKGEGLTGRNWNFNGKKDVDFRGTGTYRDALDEAFKRTGVPRDQFKITKWGKDVNGKSVPVEWEAPGGAQVNMDIPQWNNVKPNGSLGEGPHQPHIGYQTPGKGTNRVRGHIFTDDVPATRR